LGTRCEWPIIYTLTTANSYRFVNQQCQWDSDSRRTQHHTRRYCQTFSVLNSYNIFTARASRWYLRIHPKVRRCSVTVLASEIGVMQLPIAVVLHRLPTASNRLFVTTSHPKRLFVNVRVKLVKFCANLSKWSARISYFSVTYILFRTVSKISPSIGQQRSTCTNLF